MEQLLEEDFPALGEEHPSQAEPPLPPPESPPPAAQGAAAPAVPAFSYGDRVRICSWEARRLLLGKEGTVQSMAGSSCMIELEIKQGSHKAFLVPASHCCLVNPVWLDHKPLRQTAHLDHPG